MFDVPLRGAETRIRNSAPLFLLVFLSFCVSSCYWAHVFMPFVYKMALRGRRRPRTAHTGVRSSKCSYSFSADLLKKRFVFSLPPGLWRIAKKKKHKKIFCAPQKNTSVSYPAKSDCTMSYIELLPVVYFPRLCF